MANFQADVVQASAFIGGHFLTQGKNFFVKPNSGGGYSGLTPKKALKTLTAALVKCTADQNDIVNLFGESNTASLTTDYQSETLDWNKNLTHLIGVGSGSPISSRARVAFLASYNSASNLFTLSASGCLISGVSFFAGVAGTSPTGCVKVTGSRNRFERCHLAGIGHDNNDIANAFSLYLSGSENFFKECVIGLDTITRGTADNAEIILAGAATRNIFEDCIIISAAGANTHQFLKQAASATDRFTLFRRCTFINFTLGGGASMLEAFDVTAGGSPAGTIILDGCSVFGAANWEASSGVSGIVLANMVIPATGTGCGVGAAVTGA